MAISATAGVSANAPSAAPLQARAAQTASRFAASGAARSEALTRVTLSNAGIAAAALDAAVDNARDAEAFAAAAQLADTSTRLFDVALTTPRTPNANAASAAEARPATRGTVEEAVAQPIVVTTPNRQRPGPGFAAGAELLPAGEAAALALDAQTQLVRRRVAGDVVTAFKRIAVDQTYSAAATAMYLSAAIHRAQGDRPKAADAELPEPVQPIKPADSIAALGVSIGDTTAKAR